MVALVPIIGAIVGALVYGLSSNVKVGTLGLYTFAASMVALMLSLASHTAHLF